MGITATMRQKFHRKEDGRAAMGCIRVRLIYRYLTGAPSPTGDIGRFLAPPQYR